MLVPATVADVPAITAIEGGDEQRRWVGQWSAEQHAREIADPSSRYLLWKREGRAAGFIMLQEVDSPNRCILLRRICAAQPGLGDGRRMLEALKAIVFEDLGAHRLDLWVLEDNDRAYRCYRAAGFTDEGLARDLHRDADGTFRSMRLMSVLRPEWLARRQ